MEAYSTDLRERVVRAVEEGRSRDEIIEVFGVSRATIKRYLKQQRETGELTAKVIPGRPVKKGDALCAELLPQLEANRDATLEKHCQMWEAEHGQQVSAKTQHYADPANPKNPDKFVLRRGAFYIRSLNKPES